MRYVDPIISDRIKVVYPGVQITPERNRKTISEKSIITYFGPFKKWRGVSQLLLAFKRVVAKHPNTELVLACPRSSSNQLNHFEKELQANISPNIRVLGRVNDVLREILEPSTLVCLPFILAGVDPPLTILEAMAARKPVISTKIQGISEFLMTDQTGLLTEPGNVDDLAGAMDKLLTNPELGVTLGRNAREQVRKFCDWTKITEEFDLVFQEATTYHK